MNTLRSRVGFLYIPLRVFINIFLLRRCILIDSLYCAILPSTIHYLLSLPFYIKKCMLVVPVYQNNQKAFRNIAASSLGSFLNFVFLAISDFPFLH